jgi:hypothetical protein
MSGYAETGEGKSLFAASFEVPHANMKQHRCLGEIAKRIALEDMEPSLAHRGASVAAFGLTSADRARLVRQTMEREMSAAF